MLSKSLAAVFGAALLATTALTSGIASADSYSYPLPYGSDQPNGNDQPDDQIYSNPDDQTNVVTPSGDPNVCYNVLNQGQPLAEFPLTGKAFTQVTDTYGNQTGCQFDNVNDGVVVTAYNLDNPDEYEAFTEVYNEASQNEAALQQQNYELQRQSNPTYYYNAPRPVYVAPVVPLIEGLIIADLLGRELTHYHRHVYDHRSYGPYNLCPFDNRDGGGRGNDFYFFRRTQQELRELQSQQRQLQWQQQRLQAEQRQLRWQQQHQKQHQQWHQQQPQWKQQKQWKQEGQPKQQWQPNGQTGNGQGQPKQKWKPEGQPKQQWQPNTQPNLLPNQPNQQQKHQQFKGGQQQVPPLQWKPDGQPKQHWKPNGQPNQEQFKQWKPKGNQQQLNGEGEQPKQQWKHATQPNTVPQTNPQQHKQHTQGQNAGPNGLPLYLTTPQNPKHH